MHKYAADHPSLCRLMDLGPTTNLARPHRLWALIISDEPAIGEPEPEVLLTSTMHGDETTGFVLMLRLIDHLLQGYCSDPEITDLVDQTEIWINPLANPDGTYFGGNATVADAIRSYTTTGGGNSGVDPNRNFPGFVGDQHPDGNPWWLETETMMALAENKTFVLSANFHGGVEVVNYPWDTVERRHPDDLWFETLARDWADLAQADSPGGYMTDFNNGITNGYDWYPVDGGRQDFMTFFHGGREVTIEISETKLLPAEELDNLWTWNRRALLDFMAHAHQGIRGVVRGRDGEPLVATIEVLGVDREEERIGQSDRHQRVTSHAGTVTPGQAGERTHHKGRRAPRFLLLPRQRGWPFAHAPDGRPPVVAVEPRWRRSAGGGCGSTIRSNRPGSRRARSVACSRRSRGTGTGPTSARAPASA